jgi:hypothetical protein
VALIAGAVTGVVTGTDAVGSAACALDTNSVEDRKLNACAKIILTTANFKDKEGNNFLIGFMDSPLLFWIFLLLFS